MLQIQKRIVGSVAESYILRQKSILNGSRHLKILDLQPCITTSCGILYNLLFCDILLTALPYFAHAVPSQCLFLKTAIFHDNDAISLSKPGSLTNKLRVNVGPRKPIV